LPQLTYPLSTVEKLVAKIQTAPGLLHALFLPLRWRASIRTENKSTREKLCMIVLCHHPFGWMAFSGPMKTIFSSALAVVGTQARSVKNRNLLLCLAGGLLTVKTVQVVPKYANEARVWYGVCAPTIKGKQRPQMTKPWNYTERKLVSYKMYKQKVKEELVKKRNLKREPWKSYSGDNPYEERYGLTWESEVCKLTALKPFRSVHHMINHMVDEGNCVFAKTNRAETWMHYHDNLSIFWEKQLTI
jgi:hypothetical protein